MIAPPGWKLVSVDFPRVVTVTTAGYKIVDSGHPSEPSVRRVRVRLVDSTADIYLSIGGPATSSFMRTWTLHAGAPDTANAEFLVPSGKEFWATAASGSLELEANVECWETPERVGVSG